MTEMVHPHKSGGSECHHPTGGILALATQSSFPGIGGEATSGRLALWTHLLHGQMRPVLT